MAFKIAYGAGHYLQTAGKRLPKKLDASQTREWTLNDRVARHFAAAAAEYENVELLRVDDPTGKTEVSLSTRCKRANDWGADFCLAIHHNAGVNLGSGGGICAFSYKEGTKAAEYRDEIYDACIAAGGLKGNRSDPTLTANFYVLMYTKAPAVLMEYGFMDSTTDAPVILTDAYSKLVAYATMAGIAKAAGLKRKAAQPVKEQTAATANKATAEIKAKNSARYFNRGLAGTYTVTASALNVRHGAGITNSVMVTIPRGTAVKCYGYYSTFFGANWLYVQFDYKGTTYTGFASAAYLKKA